MASSEWYTFDHLSEFHYLQYFYIQSIILIFVFIIMAETVLKTKIRTIFWIHFTCLFFVFCPTIMLHFQLFLHGIIWVFFWCTTEKTKISLISVLPMNRQRKLQGIKLLCAESELPFCVVLFFFLLWTKFLTMFRLV